MNGKAICALDIANLIISSVQQFAQCLGNYISQNTQPKTLVVDMFVIGLKTNLSLYLPSLNILLLQSCAEMSTCCFSGTTICAWTAHSMCVENASVAVDRLSSEPPVPDWSRV